MGAATLTLAEAARMMREALRDRSYRSTPLGLEVARYYRWKKNEWGATAGTLRDYEAILAKLALDHADLELADFCPPVGTERLREFIDARWGERTPRTRAKVISVLRDFFPGPFVSGSLPGTRRRRSSGLGSATSPVGRSRRPMWRAWSRRSRVSAIG